MSSGSFVLASCLAMFFGVGTAFAQSGVDRVNVEFSLWNPPPHLVLSSSTTTCTSLANRLVLPAACSAGGVQAVTSGGSPVDFINAFGLRDNVSTQFGLTVRAFRNHRLRVGVLPIVYLGAIQNRTVVDLGPHGAIGLNGVQVVSEVTWKSRRFGYEWDFISRDRGFVGVTVDLKHTGLSANAHAVGFSGVQQVALARNLTVPTIGVVGERRVASRLSVGGDVAVFRLDRWRSETFHNIDVFATANVVRRVGARFGYRLLIIDYDISNESQNGSMIYRESADVRTRGPYVGAVVRF